jgi:peptide/nickel transport system substrate-binding protein
MAVDRDAIVKAFFFGHASPAIGYVNPAALDGDAEHERMMPRYDPAAANKLLDEAGWVRGADGIRVKDGQRASFLLYGINSSEWTRMSEAIQADLRRIGLDLRIQLFDATIGWGKLSTQEFDAFVMSYPYVTATDAMALYFNSANRPTPNRMNWNNADTDRWLTEAKGALDPAIRKVAMANVQRQMAQESVWLPLVREQLWVAASARAEGVRAHGIYGVGLYKGLDIRLTR